MKCMQPKRLLITAGGTGGHLFPAQALAKKLQKELPTIQILFVGGHLTSSSYFDASLFPFKEIACSTFSCKQPVSLCKSFFKNSLGVYHSVKILREYLPDLIIGFGSYHTAPLLMAAKLLKKRLILHEANSIPGMVIRLFSSYAVCTGAYFPQIANHLKGKVILLKQLLRENFQLEFSRQEALLYFGLEDTLPIILIFGGSQGARALNAWVKEHLPTLKGLPFQFIHLTGDLNSCDELEQKYKEAQLKATVKAFEGNMHLAWKIASFFIGRAGASTIFEAIACMVPGILIPFPFATDDHQNYNADFFIEEVKGGIKIQEKLLKEISLKEILKSFSKTDSLKKMKCAISDYQARIPSLEFSELVMEVLTT